MRFVNKSHVANQIARISSDFKMDLIKIENESLILLIIIPNPRSYCVALLDC